MGMSYAEMLRTLLDALTMADIEIWTFPFQDIFHKLSLFQNYCGNVLRRNVTHPITIAEVEIWNFQRHFQKCSLLWQYVTPKCYAPCYDGRS